MSCSTQAGGGHARGPDRLAGGLRQAAFGGYPVIHINDRLATPEVADILATPEVADILATPEVADILASSGARVLSTPTGAAAGAQRRRNC